MHLMTDDVHMELVAVAEDGPSIGLQHATRMLGLVRDSNFHPSEARLTTVEEEARTWC